ncbi:MAG: phosphatidylglycerophosphatase A [Elusimicrobia bacterium]|nr:phosphatidylglycerophosphatase A [Elusimicrobiota bacterium]
MALADGRSPCGGAARDGGRGLIRGLCVALATGLYLSYIPRAVPGLGGWKWTHERRWTGAGLIGSLEGLALAALLPRDPWRLALLLAAAIVAACWICGEAEKALGARDDSRIILDELVGFWTAVAFLPGGPASWLAGLVLFRAFDAVKFAPIGWLERLPGGVGVVADDVGAGLAANVVLRVVQAWAPGWF